MLTVELCLCRRTLKLQRICEIIQRQMVGTICRLCFKESAGPIDIFSAEGIKLNIAEILRAHFPDEVNESDDVLPKFLCKHCWRKSNQFHKFYNAVAEAKQTFLVNAVKIEEPTFVEVSCGTAAYDGSPLKIEPIDDNEIDDLHSADNGFEVESREDQQLDEHSTETNIAPFVRNNSAEIKCEEATCPDPALIQESICSKSNVDTPSVNCKLMSKQQKRSKNLQRPKKKPESNLSKDHTALKVKHKVSKVLKCQFCNREFGRRYDAFQRHLELRASAGVGDVKCDDVFKGDLSAEESAELAKSIYEKTCKYAKEQLAPLIPNYFDMKCEMCTYEFKSLSAAHIHYKEKHKLTKVTLKCCHRELPLLFIRDHILWHLNPDVFKCKECGKCFASGYLLRNHTKWLHTAKSVGAFECDICQKKFGSLLRIRGHIYKSHGRDKGRFECDICKKRFNTKTQKEQHTIVKHQNFRHVCHICAKEYVTLGGLQDHVLTHDNNHEKMPRVKCKLCPGTFKFMRGLRMHMKRHHVISAELQCPHCPKKLLNKHLFTAHVLNRHKYKIHTCDLCKREFRSPLELKRHMQSHIVDDMKKCDYCPKQFKEKRYVTIHMKLYHKSEWETDHIKGDSD